MPPRKLYLFRELCKQYAKRVLWFYNVQDGNIVGDNNREVSLPVGKYNIVYWGTPKYEEPIHTTPAIDEPGLSIGSDLSKLYFGLRQYNKDTTYIPVYDLVHTNKEVNIGQEDLEANMERVVAGLKVIVKTKTMPSSTLTLQICRFLSVE